MLKGHANIDACGGYAIRHKPVSFLPLGRTGLQVGQAGFGGYRISDGVAHHETALKAAIRSGINLIDTSTNYADGGSETLVGKVLGSLTASGDIQREQVVVISKVGYLQGNNYSLSQQRKSEGRPFPELVEYAQGLEHCIHPEFIEDQLTRSLERLNLETLDGYLLHNPEYYLGWAKSNGVALDKARSEYYSRIQNAFAHLEKEVLKGRLRFYGISSNTFPGRADDPEFTCLETAWHIAQSISADHHFNLVQMPFNLMEPGAVLETNQPSGLSVLSFARQKSLGVLINRPLNAFFAGRLQRLADLGQTERTDTSTIIAKIRQLSKSETRLWKHILPGLDIPEGLKLRVKQQNELGDSLKHYWKNFGSYENFRQARTGMFQPRAQGVLDFLAPLAQHNTELSRWIDSHHTCLQEALDAVASLYAEQASRMLKRIGYAVNQADPDWEKPGTLSQKAVRALRSTAGVSCVLVGMRQSPYVADIVEELRRPVSQGNRLGSWESLRQGFENM